MSYLLKCPTCGKRNRVPAEKEGVAGRCGNCGTVLPPLYYRPHALDERSFDDFVRTYTGPILAEFWAPW